MSSFKFLSGLLFGVFSASGSSWEDAWTLEKISDFENVDHKAAFDGWKLKFGKTYSDISEESHRFLVFLENWKKINDHNINGNSTYRMKLNQFGDLTSDEFRYAVHGHLGSCMKYGERDEAMKKIRSSVESGNVEVPSSIDWTDYNGYTYVTPVKNQGSCGSCWSFSTTGAIESRYAIKTGYLNSLSEQELIDCSDSYGNAGCDGGIMQDAFQYAINNGGLCSESEYSYTASDGTCRSSSCGTKYDAISSYANVATESVSSLEAAVAYGPVSIAIEADQYAFQFYSGGVLTGTCGTSLDHGVLIVGYGEESGQEYWKVKNSWGDSWGEGGYILICRNCGANNGQGECGILDDPSYPIV